MKIKNIAYILVVLLMIILSTVIYINYNNPKRREYKEALAYLKNKDYDNAIKIFEKLNNYKDSNNMLKESKYLKAKKVYEEGYITSSYNQFRNIMTYKDVDKILKNDIFNIIGMWSYVSNKDNKYIYISLQFDNSEDKMNQKIYVGSDNNNNGYKKYKIIKNDIYVYNTDNWDKVWHIDVITKSTLTVKRISSNNTETYVLAKIS